MPQRGRVIVNGVTFVEGPAGYIEVRTNTDSLK
jgi:hypothetical protein